MTRKLEVQERLKEIAAEMGALADAEQLTDEQSAQYDAYEKEADDLTVELADLQAAEEKEARQKKAQAVRDFAKASGRVTAPNPIRGDGIGRVRPAVADDPNRGFKSFAHFVTRVTDSHANVRGDEMLMQVAAGTGMTQSVNSEGGVLVPPAFSKTIWDKVLVKSNSLLSYCDPLPVDPGVESITVPAIAESSRVDGSRMGGIRGYWKSELQVLTESRPAFREVTLKPQELYVFAFISDKLLRNSPGTASRFLESGCADEIAFKIGDAIINGDGNGKPRGILTAPCTLSISKETGQAAATVLTQNVRKMNARLHPNWASGAVWFCNPDVLPALEQLVFEIGTGGVPVFLPPGGLTSTPYSMLYGKPVIPIEYCATLGTVGDLILANLGAYAAAVKGTVDSAYSMHLKFDYAQTAYRVIFEIDGQPWLNTAITPFKGTNTTSPFLTLATRSYSMIGSRPD